MFKNQFIKNIFAMILTIIKYKLKKQQLNINIFFLLNITLLNYFLMLSNLKRTRELTKIKYLPATMLTIKLLGLN